ncbi:unannotated protein [freshwater metagenome]|uniref:Unannotated protein n=1 Tax=freshwater metagenome TaxID=449393 RepID=A0A6J6M5I9_9ZZZZ
MYAHEIGRMLADPKGAALIGPGPEAGPALSSNGWFGKKGAKCDLQTTGPTPGPPPP